MRTSQSLLYRFRHDPGCDFLEVSVTYLDRGAPGDLSTVSGAEITDLGPGFFHVEREGRRPAPVPYHRIRRITYAGVPVWEKG
ncbi:DUF504 domain-containing protein [Methanofollis fontis]|uniref:DUF504 domain-containing protein n=1 Tax=Methanofollis fontis TaxID=2052832 RepID=A0A483CSA0_9EURY|nr:DUF504 domain-containing protein [Methanofollis fontis]TAJ43226.1 DUF504 domain-containing protein [Methanofollis fontis]